MATQAVAPERNNPVQTTLATTGVRHSLFPTVRGTVDTTVGTLLFLETKDYVNDWVGGDLVVAEPEGPLLWDLVHWGFQETRQQMRPVVYYGKRRHQLGLDYVNLRLSQMLVRSPYEPQPYPGRAAILRAVSYAGALIGDSVPTPSVVPSEDGGVTFVWHKGGWDVEVEVTSYECSVWARHRATRKKWSGSIEDHWYDLTSLLGKLGADARA